jgi:glucokinase
MLQQEPSSASPREILMAPETGYVVGADIGGTSLRLALAGMDGEVVGKWKVSTAGIRDPEAVVRLIHEGVEDLLQQKALSRSLLRAVAAGAPGITNVDEGIVVATSYLMGWRDVGLRALLEASLGVPAAVENDVNTAAIAESKMGAAQGIRDFVFLAIGTGIGAGIVLNGRLFHGMNWSAGEIGYMLVPRNFGEARGKRRTRSSRKYRRRRGHKGPMAEYLAQRPYRASERPGRHRDL